MAEIDFEKYRLRTFVQKLIEMDEVEIHDQPLPLTKLSGIIEATTKAILFKNAGPERVELVAKVAGSRRRLAAAFNTSEDKLYDTYFARKANPQKVVEVPSDEAPVQAVRFTGTISTCRGCRSTRSMNSTGAATSAPPSTTPSIQ